MRVACCVLVVGSRLWCVVCCCMSLSVVCLLWCVVVSVLLVVRCVLVVV